jgi:hypothetical protein
MKKSKSTPSASSFSGEKIALKFPIQHTSFQLKCHNLNQKRVTLF